MIIEHQDTDIILINPYTYTGHPDTVYLKKYLPPHWNGATIGNDYRLLMNRRTQSIIQIDNEFYQGKYQAIESSLTGNVLILGMGLATLDAYLSTGTNWVWVEINSWLVANVTPVNGVVVQGDAEDIDFLATSLPLPLYDTILIDFPQTRFNDYSSLLDVGGTIIEMTL